MSSSNEYNNNTTESSSVCVTFSTPSSKTIMIPPWPQMLVSHCLHAFIKQGQSWGHCDIWCLSHCLHSFKQGQRGDHCDIWCLWVTVSMPLPNKDNHETTVTSDVCESLSPCLHQTRTITRPLWHLMSVSHCLHAFIKQGQSWDHCDIWCLWVTVSMPSSNKDNHETTVTSDVCESLSPCLHQTKTIMRPLWHLMSVSHCLHVFIKQRQSWDHCDIWCLWVTVSMPSSNKDNHETTVTSDVSESLSPCLHQTRTIMRPLWHLMSVSHCLHAFIKQGQRGDHCDIWCLWVTVSMPSSNKDNHETTVTSDVCESLSPCLYQTRTTRRPLWHLMSVIHCLHAFTKQGQRGDHCDIWCLRVTVSLPSSKKDNHETTLKSESHCLHTKHTHTHMCMYKTHILACSQIHKHI